jgi:hypothetical protein
MAFVPFVSWNSRSITHLANYLSRSLPMNSSDESIFGGLVAPLVTSFIDAAVVVTTGWGRDYWVLWTTRLFSNILATITLVPTIVMAVVNGASPGHFILLIWKI